MAKVDSRVGVAAGAVTKEQASHEAPLSRGDGFWTIREPRQGKEVLYNRDVRILVTTGLRKVADSGDIARMPDHAVSALARIHGASAMFFEADLANYEALMLASQPAVTEDEALYLIASHWGWVPDDRCVHPDVVRQYLYASAHDHQKFEDSGFLDDNGVKALLNKILHWSDAEVVSVMHSVLTVLTVAAEAFDSDKLGRYFRVEGLSDGEQRTKD